MEKFFSSQNYLELLSQAAYFCRDCLSPKGSGHSANDSAPTPATKTFFLGDLFMEKSLS